MRALDRNKRILFVSLGGWDTTLCLRARSLARHLKELGWIVAISIPDLPEDDDAVEDGVSVVKMPNTLVGVVTGISHLISSMRPDFVHFLNVVFSQISFYYYLFFFK